MIKCANCDKPAVYTNADPGVNPVDYCAICLPVWLRDRATQGHFPLATSTVVPTEEVVEEVVEEVKVAKKKTTTSSE